MDSGTQSSATDGTLFFRARLGTAGAGIVFDVNLFVGLDANGDGALDLYLGVHNEGRFRRIGHLRTRHRSQYVAQNDDDRRSRHDVCRNGPQLRLLSSRYDDD